MDGPLVLPDPVVKGAGLYAGIGDYVKVEPKRYAPKTLRETAEGRYWRVQGSRAHQRRLAGHQPPLRGRVPVPARGDVLRQGHGVQLAIWKTAQDVRQVQGHRVLEGAAQRRARHGRRRPGWDRPALRHELAIHLRQFEDHGHAAVRSVKFSPQSYATIASASDDTTVRIWDVAAGECVRRHDGHTDYARSIAGHPTAQTPGRRDLDHTVRLWDNRDGSTSATMTLDHGSPVEDVTWLPSGSLLVSVGGRDACVWDVLGGGGNFWKASRCHQKTDHELPRGARRWTPAGAEHGSFAARAGAGGRATAPRLLTGSLDRHVKVHELDDFSVAHSAKYPGPVLAVALSPDANALAVGTANKLLSIRRRTKPRSHALGGGGGGGDSGFTKSGPRGGEKRRGGSARAAGSTSSAG